MLDYEINEFGRRLGLNSLQLHNEGPTGLKLDAYTLTLEHGEGSSEGSLIMSLQKALEPTESIDMFREALHRASWEKASVLQFTPALFRDHLILTVKLPENEITGITLDNALRFLLEEIEFYR